MGALGQFVGAVVTTAENATGQQGSDAGNWAEDQASNLEGAAGAAGEKAAEGAADAAGFVASVGEHLSQGVGGWLSGGIDTTGLQFPDRVSLASILGIVTGVVRATSDSLEAKARRELGSPAVDAAKRGWSQVQVGVAGGPAGVWGSVREIVTSAEESVRLRVLGGRLGVSTDAAQPSQEVPRLAERAESEHRKMLEELRAAVRRLESVPGGGGSVRIPHEFLRARSKSAEGIELRRLSAILLSSGTGGGTGTDREAGRHLAAAVSAAARSAVLHAQLALWMEGIRRIAARARTASLERRLTTGKPGRCPPSRRP